MIARVGVMIAALALGAPALAGNLSEIEAEALALINAHRAEAGCSALKPQSQLIDAARGRTMSAAEQEAQRRSFAYGNAHIENDRVTRAMVDEAAEKLSQAY